MPEYLLVLVGEKWVNRDHIVYVRPTETGGSHVELSTGAYLECDTDLGDLTDEMCSE